MVIDGEARDAVRRLVKLSESMSDQWLGLAYVLAKRDRYEYERLLEAAEIAQRTVIQPLTEAETLRHQVYAALDNPDMDWQKAVIAMFNQEPTEFWGAEAFDRLKRMQSLDERFDEEMKKRDGKRDNGSAV